MPSVLTRSRQALIAARNSGVDSAICRATSISWVCAASSSTVWWSSQKSSGFGSRPVAGVAPSRKETRFQHSGSSSVGAGLKAAQFAHVRSMMFKIVLLVDLQARR